MSNIKIGELFKESYRLETKNDCVNLYYALCNLVAYNYISDSAFRKIMKVLWPLVKHCKNAGCEMPNLEMEDSDQEELKKWIISTVYEDYCRIGVCFRDRTICEDFLFSIRKNLVTDNDVFDDWEYERVMNEADGCAVFKALDSKLFFKSIEPDNQTGDLYILSDGERKLLAEGIEDFILDREAEIVYIWYANCKGICTCYDIKTGQLRRVEETYVTNTGECTEWDRLVLEIVSRNDLEKYRLYTLIDGRIINLWENDPIEAIRRGIEVDLFTRTEQSLSVNKIREKLRLLKKWGIEYDTQRVAVLEQLLIQLLELGCSETENIRGILETLYDLRKLTMHSIMTNPLLGKKFMRLFMTILEESPTKLLTALKNHDTTIMQSAIDRNKAWLDKEDKEYQEYLEKEKPWSQYIGTFEQNNDGQIVADMYLMDRAEICGVYTVPPRYKYSGTIKFDRHKLRFVIEWSESTDIDVIKKVMRNFYLDYEEIIFCSEGKCISIEINDGVLCDEDEDVRGIDINDLPFN